MPQVVRHWKPGHTLLELVLVVVVIGIVFGIAIPRFGAMANRAGTASLNGSIAQLQRAVELYTTEHANRDPLTDPDGSPTTSGIILAQRLMRYSNELGNMGPGGTLGPYIRQWPVNPFNNKPGIRIDGPPAGAGTHGWRIDSATLKVEADHAGGVARVNGGGGAAEPGP